MSLKVILSSFLAFSQGRINTDSQTSSAYREGNKCGSASSAFLEANFMLDSLTELLFQFHPIPIVLRAEERTRLYLRRIDLVVPKRMKKYKGQKKFK